MKVLYGLVLFILGGVHLAYLRVILYNKDGVSCMFMATWQVSSGGVAYMGRLHDSSAVEEKMNECCRHD